MDNHGEDIFQTLENRQDVEFSRHFQLPNQDLEKQDFSRLDTDETHNQFDDSSNKDPLYIVHFVPSPKPKIESSSSDSNSVSTVSNDVLQKILSASKGTKPGTPQFVVFAPVPENGGTKNEEIGTLPIGSQSSDILKNKEGLDYDYEEELRKYQELLESNDQPAQKQTSRVEQSQEQRQAHTETLKEAVRLISQNYSSGNVYQNHHHQAQVPNSNILQSINNNQQQSILPQINYQQNAQDYSQIQQQGLSPQSYPQHVIQQHQNYDQQQQQQQQQYYPQESNTAVQVHPQQPQATDRSGQYEPIGIKLNFGGGRGLLGGNYSPLGIIGSILKPLLPRPQVNLNGKLMFGVMLENGIKFGNKGQNSYG